MDVELYKRLLKEKNMTYEDLANSTGLSLGCIKRIMAGIAQYPRIDTIEAIESTLGISNRITQEERAAGWRDTKSLDVTPDEDELIYWVRELGKVYGKEIQHAQVTTIVAMIKNLIEVKK